MEADLQSYVHTHSLHRGTRMVLVPLNVHYAAVAEEERVYWREA